MKNSRPWWWREGVEEWAAGAQFSLALPPWTKDIFENLPEGVLGKALGGEVENLARWVGREWAAGVEVLVERRLVLAVVGEDGVVTPLPRIKPSERETAMEREARFGVEPKRVRVRVPRVGAREELARALEDKARDEGWVTMEGVVELAGEILPPDSLVELVKGMLEEGRLELVGDLLVSPPEAP